MTVLYIPIPTVDLTGKDKPGTLGSREKTTIPASFALSAQIVPDEKIWDRQIERRKGQIF